MTSEKQQTYQWNGDDYAANSQVQLQWALELMEKLEPCGDEHLLDIGCGDGKVTAMLAARLDRGRVVGIDNSKSMIDRARKRFGTTTKNLEFVLQDAGSLSFDQQFDQVGEGLERAHGPPAVGPDPVVEPADKPPFHPGE